MSDKTFYITTPIYYPSAKFHIGHCYTTVAADTMTRFKKMTGCDTYFLTGTDEHGQKIQRTAEKAGVSPKEYVDKIVAGAKELWKTMNIEYDKFIRTTDTEHKAAVQKIFKKLYDNGDIYKGAYEGQYCTPCESYWTEAQLVDGKCPDCGREVELTKEDAYFFKLSKYQDRLLKHIGEHPEFIQPETRKNEMLNFINQGLEDLCVSRTSFSWGVPVPFDEGHVVYVWVDALSNYITALGYTTEHDELYKKYWPADVHLMSKEIVRFHTIIWPIMLMALDEPVPKQVFGHGWLVFGGEKMSKSKGNVVDPQLLAERYGADALRYYLMREMVFGQDGNFTNESLINRINSDLANDLGNLVSRTVAMVEKYFGGSLPTEQQEGEFDKDLISLAVETSKKVEELMNKLQFNVALAEVWRLVSRTNKYIDETMPWVLAKDEANKARLAKVMYNLCESVRIVSVMIEPFMPSTAPKIWQQLGLEKSGATSWESIRVWGGYPSRAKVQRGETLFPRIDVEKELEALAGTKGDVKVEDKKDVKVEQEELISIDDFMKVKFKVAKVLSAEKVEGADKLLKLQLQVGNETRTVVSGIAKFYSPDELVGKSLVVVANLKPAKLRGIESQGMILAASTEGDTELSLITLDRPIEDGSEVR